jgi:hypothetical protein
MDGLVTIGSDLGMLSAFAVVLWRVIDLFKRLFYKLPWNWVQKIPGEIWIGFSIALGIAVSILLRVNAVDSLLQDSGVVLGGIQGYAATGFLVGTSSNVVQEVVKPIGKKIKGDTVVTETTTPTVPDTPIVITPTTPAIIPTEEVEDTDEAILLVSVSTNKETPLKVDYKAMYVYVNGTLHKLFKEEAYEQ